MTPSELLSALHEMGVRVVSPGDGRVKLLVDSGAVPQAAVDLARPLKADLAAYVNSRACGCGTLMIPFGFKPDNFRNWDCPSCGFIKPIREVTLSAKLPEGSVIDTRKESAKRVTHSTEEPTKCD